jgi:hypothetical protein
VTVPIGTIVVVEAPGSRGEESEVRMIPGIVMKQWPGGEVQVFAFHFEGSFLMNAVPLERCFKVGSNEPFARPKSFTVTRDTVSK